ncbi:MAG TPA: glycosyltransferase family 1 protein [Spirochaetota bacterium]|mgnify:CR=1 FL=1|nr:glycosyltransferase family 1 protein [Spirochaetota bacterium]
MIIGVDAYYLFAEHIDGLGNYLLRLLKELSRIDRDNEYYLYTPGVTHADYAEAIFANPQFRLRKIPGIFRDKRRLWLQSPSLKKQILRDGIDLFFAGAEYFPLFLPKSITVATTIHDVAYKAMPEAISLTNSLFYNIFFPFFIRRADLFFTVSNHSKKEMVDYLGIDGKKISVIHNGIELEKFPPAKKGEKKDYVLFVGTLQPRKNLVNLIKGYCLISGRVADDLVIVGGSGWKNSPLRELIDGLDEALKKRIIFKGYVAGDSLSQLYREAKLFALPSLHEGFCLPILEAMASGTAVLTARSTAIPEVFGDAAAYADPLSPEDISEKLLDLLSSNRKRTTFEKLGLVLSKKYDVRIQAAGYLSSFASIAASINKKKGTK